VRFVPLAKHFVFFAISLILIHAQFWAMRQVDPAAFLVDSSQNGALWLIAVYLFYLQPRRPQ
jgi:hypothetical protein